MQDAYGNNRRAASERAGRVAEVFDAQAATPTIFSDACQSSSVRLTMTDVKADVRELASRFATLIELQADAPETPLAMFGKYLRQGDIAVIAGPPKVGKTTFVAKLIEAIANGLGSFIGADTATCPVVFVCEERTAQIIEKLTLLNDVHCLPRERGIPKPGWSLLIAAAVHKCQQEGAGLLVIDTLRWWSDLTGEQSNKDGPVMEAMRELALASAAGITVLLIVHWRKGGGEDGEGVAGSNALVGAADVLLEYSKPRNAAAPSIRQINAISRWADGPPAITLIERVSDGFRVVGTADDTSEAASVGWHERLIEALPADGEPISISDLEVLTGEDRRKWNAPLRDLIRDAVIERSGVGRKGSPFMYARSTVQISLGANKMLSGNALPVSEEHSLNEGCSDSLLPLKRVGESEQLNNAVQKCSPSAGTETAAGEVEKIAELKAGRSVVVSAKGDAATVAWARERGLLVRVDRRGDWGNPYKIPADGDRDQVCDLFEHLYLPGQSGLLDRIGELKGRALMCHCSPLRCHADVLADFANGIKDRHVTSVECHKRRSDQDRTVLVSGEAAE